VVLVDLRQDGTELVLAEFICDGTEIVLGEEIYVSGTGIALVFVVMLMSDETEVALTELIKD